MYFCDKCGKEIKGRRSGFEDLAFFECENGINTKAYYGTHSFCEKCWEEIKKSIGVI